LKVLYDIPDPIYKQYQQSNFQIGRIELSQKCNISPTEARVYLHNLKNGKPLNSTITKPPNPESGTIKTLCLFDIHAPYHDQANLDAAINYGLINGVDEVLIGGDGVDFYAISKWFKDPLMPLFKVELKRARDVIKYISDAFPGMLKLYINGNHESRYVRHVYDNSRALEGVEIYGRKLDSISDLLELDTMGWEFIDNNELLENGLPPFRLGKLYILHGHETKVGYNVINPAKLFYERCGVSLLCGHIHIPSKWVAPSIIGKPHIAVTSGVLCGMHPDYSRVNRWLAGFEIVERDCDGIFYINSKNIVNGKVR
jgi:hypothetical protein